MNIKSMALAFAHFIKGLFGFIPKSKNPFTMTEHEKRQMFKKSKGGGRGKGMIEGLPRRAAPMASTGSENLHMGNRASWRKPRVPKADRV